MKKILLATLLVLSVSHCSLAQDYLGLSQDLLRAIKEGRPAEPYVEQLAQADPKVLEKQVATQEEKLAFWINVYNGLIQYKLQKKPAYYKDRGSFFSADILTIARSQVSFDNIEHGVLRRGTSKYSYGYFKNPFGGDWHKSFMVDKIDWRIHFALNCGARSCPPVRIYQAKTIYKQLNASTRQYLNKQVEYRPTDNVVLAPKLMDWFSGDFGGEEGALAILVDLDYLPNEEVDLEFKPYDWTLHYGPPVFYKNN